MITGVPHNSCATKIEQFTVDYKSMLELMLATGRGSVVRFRPLTE
jgi:hypothetical protein